MKRTILTVTYIATYDRRPNFRPPSVDSYFDMLPEKGSL